MGSGFSFPFLGWNHVMGIFVVWLSFAKKEEEEEEEEEEERKSFCDKSQLGQWIYLQ